MTEPSDTGAPAETVPGCAVVAQMLGANPSGTATFMRSWLLIEQPGPWPADALERVLAETFPPDRRELLDSLQQTHGLRPLLVRRPGRNLRQPRMTNRTVFVGGGEPGNRWLERMSVDALREVAELDLAAVAGGRGGHGEPVSGPILLVCTHGTKDMCCAVLGRPLVNALDANLPGRTWEVSHVGGDRWAGNLLVVPDGYLYGQLDPNEGVRVAKAAVAEQVVPDRLRGRTSTASRWSQHAEVAVRQHSGLRGLDDVLAVHEAPAPAAAPGTETRVVRVRNGDRLVDVTVRYHPADHRAVNRCAGPLATSGYVTESIRPVPAASA